MKRLSIIFFLTLFYILLVTNLYANAAPVCWFFNGNCYERIDVDYPGINWDDAKTAAESASFQGVSGHLATVTSQEENDFIVNNLGGPDAVRSHWLGGYQPPGSPEPDGGWQWITGEPFVFEGWAPAEPNNAGGNEDAIDFHGPPLSGLWNDGTKDSEGLGYIVEYPNAFAEKSINIEAHIDGRDQLVIRRNTIQWHHFDFAAVGRHMGANSPTIIYATENGSTVTATEWIPDWGSPPPDEIRFEAFSSIFSNLYPEFPNDGVPWTVTKLLGRGDVEIIEQPSISNDFALVVEINDNIPGGSRFYAIILSPIPCDLGPRFDETKIKIGSYYYTDRDYKIIGGIPSWMVGRTLIQTPNDERFDKSASGYVRFTNPVDWWVYVLFDSRSASIPDWLKGWELRGEKITTSLETQPYLKVYRKQYPSSQCVDLGGNYGPGSSSETRSNYAVVYGK